MVQIINDEQGKPIGWELLPKTEEEHKIAATIRDLQFFGLDIGESKNNTNIEYDGITLIDQTKGKVLGNLKSVRWIQAKYQNQ